jgi:DNA-binding MarR family transcriptional regulator
MNGDSCNAAGSPGGGADSPLESSRADHLLRLIHLTSSASRQLRRRLAQIAAAFELTDGELLVVWLCSGTGRVQGELAAAIGVSPAQMSGMVERLRSRDLIGMHRLAADRRRQVWRTSGAGQGILAQVAAGLQELSDAVASGASAAEQQSLEAICQRLVEAISSSGNKSASLARGADPTRGGQTSVAVLHKEAA